MTVLLIRTSCGESEQSVSRWTPPIDELSEVQLTFLEIPALDVELLVERLEQGCLLLDGNGHVVLDGVESAEDEVKDGDDARKVTVEFVNDGGETPRGLVEQLVAALHLRTVPAAAGGMHQLEGFSSRRRERGGEGTDHPDSGFSSILLRGSRQTCRSVVSDQQGDHGECTDGATDLVADEGAEVARVGGCEEEVFPDGGCCAHIGRRLSVASRRLQALCNADLERKAGLWASVGEIDGDREPARAGGRARRGRYGAACSVAAVSDYALASPWGVLACAERTESEISPSPSNDSCSPSPFTPARPLSRRRRL